MVSPDSVSAIRSGICDQMMLLHACNKIPNITFGDVSAYFEFPADFVDDGGFGCPGLKKLEDPGPDEVEVEHLSLLDIQDNGAILTVRAADAL
jgi:hypothetical protein